MKLENNLEIIQRIRVLRRQGCPAALILRELSDSGLSIPEIMSHFREAFELSFDDVSCIGGWFPDGSGELDDEAINRLLESAIPKARRLP